MRIRNALLAAARGLRNRPRDKITTGVDLASSAAVVYGVSEIYGPAAWIVAGVLGAVISYKFSEAAE